MALPAGHAHAHSVDTSSKPRPVGSSGRSVPTMARWRVFLLLGVIVVAGMLLLFRPPARLGPIGSPLAGAACLGLVSLAMIRRPAVLVVVVTVAAAALGVVGGFGAWYLDRYPGNPELHGAIAAVAPPGFREDKASRYECDFGCSPSASRTYTGTGSVSAVAEQQVVRMRRACYTDAALRVVEADTFTISGTCVAKDIALDVSVTTQGTGVVLRMTAEQRIDS